MRDKQRCPRCHTRPDEWDEDKGGHREAYDARLITCMGCNAMAAKEAEAKQDMQVPGSYIVLRPRQRR